MKKPANGLPNDLWSWLFAGMAAADFVAITQLSTRSELSSWQLNSVWFYAFALPFLVAGAVLLRKGVPITRGGKAIILGPPMGAGLLFLWATYGLFRSFGELYGIAFLGGLLTLIIQLLAGAVASSRKK